MISKIDKQEIDLVSLAKKIKASFNLKSDVSLTLIVDGLKINFASRDDFLATMQKMQEHHLYLRKGSSNHEEHLCVLEQEFIANLQRIVEPISRPSISSFKMMKDQFVNLELNHSENKVITKIKPAILNLSLDSVFSIIRYLDYERAFHLVLCLISGHIEYSEENKNKKEPSLPTFKSAFFYKELFKAVLKQKPIISSTFCFFPEYGCFAWGANKYGQLGVGHNADQNLPQLITAFKDKKIIVHAVGFNHSVFLTDNNEVYSCGWNISGQLGLGNKNNQSLPQPVTALKGKKIIAIAGYDHSLFLTDSNEVYACGENRLGQLGLGNEDDQCLPQLITALQGKKIISIAAGSNHSLFLTDTNEVYSCGYNDHGQLGLGHDTDQNLPQFITALQGKKIINIAVGDYHSVFLADDNEVYACGNNYYGQLGLGHENEQNLPQLLTALNDKKIIAITVGACHSIFVTDSNKFYACGWNKYGQLGLGHNVDQSHPQLITALENKKIIASAAGGCHSSFLTDNNEVYACGWNSFGQLGLGHNNNQNVPTKISFPIQNDLQIKEKHPDNANLSPKMK